MSTDFSLDSQMLESLQQGQVSLGDFLALSDDLPYYWVRQQEQLSRLVEKLRHCERVALDTEFIKRDTYFPKLALIQLNVGDEIYLVDAPRLDLSEFWSVLEDIKLMVWHACGEDLNIFYLLSGCEPLTNVFDTQIALSYLTGQLQMGYQQATSQFLDIQLAKEESQSDWLNRPLTIEQENYAIDDVRYLPALYLSLEQLLKKQGLFERVWEDCRVYSHEIYENHNIPDDEIYLSLADVRYNRVDMTILQSLCMWREDLARAINKPRTFILNKQNMRDLIDIQPKTMKQLAQTTTIRRHVLRVYGEEILKIIQSAKNTPIDKQPERIVPQYRSKDKVVSGLVEQAVTAFSKETNVPKNLVLRKKWLSKLYEMVALDKPMDYIAEHLPKGLQGWRKQWVLECVLPILYRHQSELQMNMQLKKADNQDEPLDEADAS